MVRVTVQSVCTHNCSVEGGWGWNCPSGCVTFWNKFLHLVPVRLLTAQAVSDVTLPRALKVRPSVCVATSVRRHLWIIRTTCSYFPGTEPPSSELGEIKTGTSLSVMNHCLKMWRRLRNAGRTAPQQEHKGGLLLVVSRAVFVTLLEMLLNRSVML